MAERISGLYLITDPNLLPGERLQQAVTAALAGGARWLQYRNKHLPFVEQTAQAMALKSLCSDYGARLIINDSLDLALACDADGLHLGQQDGAITDARKALGPDKIIGVTCHGQIERAREAQAAGADYVAFGRFFPSHTKPEAPPASLDVLREAKALGLPVVAIGGITLENASAVLHAGADALAVIHGVFAASDIRQRVEAFSELMTKETRHV